MNRIYRRVWNRTRQCWVVASELASTAGKPRSTAAGAVLLGLVLAVPSAEASDIIAADECDESIWQALCLNAGVRAGSSSAYSLFSATPRAGINALELGYQAKANGYGSSAVGPEAKSENFYSAAFGWRALAGASYSVAAGANAQATESFAIAMGRDSKASAMSAVAIGGQAAASGQSSVALGSSAVASADSAHALGYLSQATAKYATAVGTVAKAFGAYSIAVGNHATAIGDDAIAIGRSARTVDSSAGISRIAIGGGAFAGTGGYTGAIAIGGSASSEYDGISLGYGAKATVSGSIALGSHSLANEANSISVGNGSIKRRIVNLADARLSTTSTDAVTGKQLNATNGNVASAQAAADAAKATANTANTNANTALAKANAVSGLVSQVSASGNVRLGGENTGTVLDVRNKSNAVRSITGLKDGALSTSSTEAVTGKQLNATNANVSKAQAAADATATRLNASAVALGAGAVAEQASYGISTALGNNAKAYNGKSVAMGADARATVDDAGNKISGNAGVSIGAGTRSGNGAVALGLDAVATGDRGVAVGHEASGKGTHATALGFQSNASANQATAVGRGAVASSLYASALGNQASAKAQSALALGDRANAAHAGAVALGNGSATTGTNQVSVGNDSLKRKVVNVADAALSTSSSEAVTGKQLHATNTSVAAVKATADGAQARVAVLDGLVGQVSASGNVRLGADNTGTVVDVANKSGAKRKLQNLANGVLSTSSTDAVTGQQLNATNSEVTSVRTAATAAKTAADAARGLADGAVQKADALGGLVGQVSASGNVRLGAENTGTIVDVANKTGAKRRVYNIANGTLSAGSTDAVTGQQLFATNATVETQRQALAGHAQQLTDQDGRITDNRVELDALRADFDNFDPDLDGVVKFSADRHLVDMEGARVSGVAAGDISSAASTDAVNGGQLFATNLALRKIEERGEFVQVGWDAQSSSAEAGSLAVAIGSDAKAIGSGATAIGAYSLSSGINSVAIGRGSQVALGAEGGFALGSGTKVAATSGVAIGVASQIASGADGAVALGATSIATEANVVSVGNDTLRRRIVNIDRGRGSSDAVVVAQLRESLAFLGGGATLDQQGNVIGPMYNIQGGVHSTVDEALTALDSAVVTTGSRVDRVETQLRSVFQEAPSTRSDGSAQLTLAGANGMVISNVANGLIAAGSREAVNGGQLHAVQQQLNGRMDGLEQRVDGQPQSRALSTASAAPTEQVTPTPEASDSPQVASAGEGTSPTPQPKSKKDDTPSPTPQVDTAELEKMLARANEYTDGAISNFERRLDKMDKRFNRMAAMSSAQTAMAMNTAGLATYNRLGAGVGYAEGESAMAVGYQRVLNEKGSATFSLNGAFTNSGERSMGVGVGIGW
nr:ESPR-type extended signal peptide-containing protein [Stenotrophomonas geniculata]